MTEVSPSTIMAVIAGMAVMNLLIRATPMTLLARFRELPGPLLRWLSFVPVSVMGALVATEVLRPRGEWAPPLSNPGIPAALLTALTFRLTKSFIVATLAGMVAFIALRALM